MREVLQSTGRSEQVLERMLFKMNAGANATEHADQNYELSRHVRFEKMASRDNTVFWMYKRQQCDLDS